MRIRTRFFEPAILYASMGLSVGCTPVMVNPVNTAKRDTSRHGLPARDTIAPPGGKTAIREVGRVGALRRPHSRERRDDMRSSNAIRMLIDSGRDSERTLRHESKFVDSSRRPTLQRLAAECQASVEQLLSLRSRRRRGGVSGSWLALIRELRRNLRVALGGRNSGDAVAACRRSMSRADALYGRALALPLPAGTASLLLERRKGIRRANDELVAIQF